MLKHVIIGNYGNNTIALLQWLIEAKLSACGIVSIDTGWAAHNWHERVAQGEAYAGAHGVQVVRLQSPLSFQELAQDRGAFPSVKYQWCAGLLKGAVLNAWLDECDPQAEVIILLAKCRASARGWANLPEYIAESAHYGDRKIWHPLYNHTLVERDQLIRRAGFVPLNHHSLECDPCVHANLSDFQRIAAEDIEKTTHLEHEVVATMFPDYAVKTQDFRQLVHWARQQKSEPSTNNDEAFALGCGSPWGCGD